MTQIFWLSFFKSSLSVSTDELIQALRELTLLNQLPESYFEERYDTVYRKLMLKTDFCVSLADNSTEIIYLVEQIHHSGLQKAKFSALEHQMRLKTVPREKTEYIDESKLSTKYKIG